MQFDLNSSELSEQFQLIFQEPNEHFELLKLNSNLNSNLKIISAIPVQFRCISSAIGGDSSIIQSFSAEWSRLMKSSQRFDQFKFEFPANGIGHAALLPFFINYFHPSPTPLLSLSLSLSLSFKFKSIGANFP